MCHPTGSNPTTSPKATLLAKLGGEDALNAAVNELYSRLMKDEQLKPFFDGVNMTLLKIHQKKFMTMAFTEIPEDMDVAGVIAVKHRRLFDKGLDETHFDIVAGHFVATFQSLNVPQNLIDEAVSVIAPLRGVFEHGAIDSQERRAIEKPESSSSLPISVTTGTKTSGFTWLWKW